MIAFFILKYPVLWAELLRFPWRDKMINILYFILLCFDQFKTLYIINLSNFPFRHQSEQEKRE